MREARAIPAAPVWDAPDTGTQLRVRLRTITPVFGGGASSRESEDHAPVRPAAIRGHLRYWWRASVGASSSSVAALFAKESELWGNQNEHGKVRLTVQVEAPGQRVDLAGTGKRIDPNARPRPAVDGPQEAYFLFPFQEQKQAQKQEQIPAAQGRWGIVFVLQLDFPSEYQADIDRTLRAWLLFGGIGARTRRGCGALECLDKDAKRRFHPPAPAQMDAWLQALAGTPLEPKPDWTTLAGGKLVLGEEWEPLKIWRELGTFWSRFRKGHYTQSCPDYVPMNGGKWRDHSTLREWERRQQTALPLAKPQLGLPIIYQKFPARGNAPASFGGTIESAETSRMTSPVVLKPVALADGSYRPLVAYLIGKRPKQIRISGHGKPIDLLPVTPEQEPVLASLGSGGPLNAVIRAARREWKDSLEWELR